MKTNKTIKLISSLLIFLIIFSLTLSATVGCDKQEGDTSGRYVDDPEGSAVISALFIAVFIEAEGKRIKNEKALDKAIQEANEENKAKAKAKAKAAQESFNAEIEAQYDFRKDILDTVLYGPGAADSLEHQRRLNAYVNLMIEIGKDVENQDSENQNTSITTVPQAQEATQTTEKEKPTGTITLALTVDDYPSRLGEMVINFEKKDVSGSFNEEFEGSTYYATFEGSVDINTSKITADGSEEYTGDITAYIDEPSGWITLEGVISSDYKSAVGTYSVHDGTRYIWRGTVK